MKTTYLGPSFIEGSLIVDANCQICQERIEKAALLVNGVYSAHWRIADGKLDLLFDSSLTSLNQISMAIAQVGHTTNLHKANKESLDKMEDCCKSIK